MSDAAHLLATAVAAHRPVDARERASQEAFLGHLARLSAPFDEHADPVHVTASAIVIARPPSTGHVLLHLHRRLGRWLQPGGHIDPGESPVQAALREMDEETGLAGVLLDGERIAHIDVHPGGRGHTHLDVRYLVGAPFEVPRPPEGESPHVAWFTWEEAIALADDGLKGALRALQPWAGDGSVTVNER
jgi:8-oxo-dGTP pyrophosphatase MutT (NUDIX family)